jgi:hypothetical protein
MAESNNTTDGGTAGPSESAQDVSARPDSGVNDVIVENIGDGDLRVAGADDALPADSAAMQASAPAMSDADMLRLADLLQSEHDGNLDTLLTFTSDGTDTTLHVGSAQVGQDIVLQGVGDLTAGGARSASAIIADLLTHGSLSPDV